MKNILFVWTGVTAYMADCWRTLAQSPEVSLKVLIQEKRETNTRFDHSAVLDSLDVTLFYDDEPLEPEKIQAIVSAFVPDVLFIVGWRSKLSRMIATDPAYAGLPKVLIFDLPFAWTPRKLLAPLVLRRYLKLFDGCFVPGARAVAYAKWLGFKPEQIKQGLFAVKSHAVFLASKDASERKNFLFVSRYVKEKRLDVLVKAYKRYRLLTEARNEEPWSLSCCGMGPDARFLQGVEGVCDLGFCQPEEVASLRLNHGALVLASEFDPWPLVIAEACAAGLPIICTEACGSHVELVRGNGIVCKTNDVESLAQAMLKISAMSDLERLSMGQEGRYLVKAYSCEAWSERVRECVEERSVSRLR